MSDLNQALQKFITHAQLAPKHIFNPRHIQATIEKFEAAEQSAEIPKFNQNELLDKIKTLSAQNILHHLKVRERKNMIWLLWETEHNGERCAPPIEWPNVLNFINTQMIARSSLRSMVSMYFHFYNPKDQFFVQFSQTVKKVAAQNKGPWQDLQKEFDLFTPGASETKIAHELFNSWLGIDASKQVSKLNKIDSASAYFSYLSQFLAELLNRKICGKITAETLAELLTRLRPSGLDMAATSEARLLTMSKADIANALISPWLQEQPPAPELQVLVQNYLLERYGHPVLKPQNWQGVQQSCKDLFNRWLVKESFNQFFDVIDEVVKQEKNSDRHWRYRRPFWTTYLEEDFISDCVVIFGRDAQRIAHQIFKDKAMPTGTFLGGGKTSQHSAILMLLNDGTVITEWSHNGYLHIFWPDNKNKPPFKYGPYNNDMLTSYSDRRVAHTHSDKETWQKKTKSIIEKQNGINPKGHFMPTERT